MVIRARDGLIRLRDEEKLLRQHLHMEGTRSGAQWTTAFKEEDTDRREMKMARGRYARGAPGKESDVIPSLLRCGSAMPSFRSFPWSS